MAFGQLYYTSCEHGLAGFPGYQFNAATPGLPAEVLRAVEALTAYEPPRSLDYGPTDAEIAAAPVNLCYQPAAAGATAAVANVVFVGADFSQRFGNYFAHALVSTDPARDLAGLLPIELWGAPFWVRTPVLEPALPELAAARPGGLTRAVVGEFVRGRSAAPLARLLAAADLAMSRGERSVLIIEPDAAAAAAWIAAVCYLLPPGPARRLSFATYQRRPSYSTVHVIGTVPDVDLDLDGPAFEDFYLFDMASGRSTEIAVGPAARLLGGIGPVGAARVWAEATALTGAGPDGALDSWHPMLAVAAAMAGHPLAGSDLDAAVRWLAADAARIGPARVLAAGRALLDQAGPDDQPAVPDRPGEPGQEAVRGRRSGLTDQQFGALAAAADRAGAWPLLDAVELRMVDASLDALPTTGRPAALPISLRGPTAASHAAARSAELLAGADAQTAVALMEWAIDAGIPLPAEALVAAGRGAVGALALRDPADPQLHRALARAPELRAGVAAHLAAAAAARPDEVSAALRRGLADVLAEGDLAAAPALHEPLLLARAARAPELRVSTLSSLAGRAAARGPAGGWRNGPAGGAAAGRAGPVDDRLLDLLWPGTDWSVAEARAVLQALTAEQACTPAVAARLSRVLTRPLPPDPRQSHAHARLAADLAGHPVRGLLNAAGEDLVEDYAWLAGWLRKSPAQLPDVLIEQYPTLHPTVRRYLLGRLVDLLPGLGPRRLAGLLATAPVDVLDAYLSRLGALLQPAGPDLAGAAHAVQVGQRLRPTAPARADRVEAALAAALAGWHRRDLDALSDAIELVGEPVAAEFAAWRKRELPGGLTRRLGPLRRRRPEPG